MHRYLKAIICIAVAAVSLFSFTASASDDVAEQGIKFAVYCETAEDIEAAVQAGAEYVSIGGGLTLSQAATALKGRAALIIDADSIEKAQEKYFEMATVSVMCDTYYRVKAGAGAVTEWAESDGRDLKLIGYYKGNIYPIAVSRIIKYGKHTDNAIVQMQTNNQDGVILHESVTSFFAKYGAEGMFSTVDSTRSAKRTDTARSWDDLIARGYTVIETAYPADFAEYLAENTAERTKLEASVNAALATSTDGCAPNRVSDYSAALEAAQALLSDGTSAAYEMADTRAVLDEAVENINIQDGTQIKGDFKITVGRVLWALFGIALILSWQIFFRSRWAKKKES